MNKHSVKCTYRSPSLPLLPKPWITCFLLCGLLFVNGVTMFWLEWTLIHLESSREKEP